MKQPRLDEVGDLTGWAIDLCESEAECYSYSHGEGTSSLSVSAFSTSNTGWHLIELIQAFFRYFNTGF